MFGEANPNVSAIQFGEDGESPLPVHVSTADQTGEGVGASLTINPGVSAGTNQNAAPIVIASGRNTGSGLAGNINFQITEPSASGSTPGVYSNKAIINSLGFVLNSGSYWSSGNQGVTASGDCVITEITGGIITGASCS